MLRDQSVNVCQKKINLIRSIIAKFESVWINVTLQFGSDKLIKAKIPLRSNKKVDVSIVVSLSEGIEGLWEFVCLQ